MTDRVLENDQGQTSGGRGEGRGGLKLGSLERTYFLNVPFLKKSSFLPDQKVMIKT